jgi:hypothetical protein
LPCDPSVGGHSCNGGMIPRFHRAVCDYFTLGRAARAYGNLQTTECVLMSAWGQIRPPPRCPWHVRYPPKAAVKRTSSFGRFVPGTDSCAAGNNNLYSITSSPRARKDS